jgi:hypothetical protein
MISRAVGKALLLAGLNLAVKAVFPADWQQIKIREEGSLCKLV